MPPARRLCSDPDRKELQMKKSYQTPEIEINRFRLLADVLAEPSAEDELHPGGGELFGDGSAGENSYSLNHLKDFSGFGW